ncbi:MAG: DUF3108 domain-containing protein [Ignavibacteria bacterium]
MKKILIFIFVLFYIYLFAQIDERIKNIRPINPSALKVGEELTYVVRYTFIPIGEIKLKVLRKYEKDGLTVYETRANIDSYEGLPFVDLHSVYTSHVTDKYFSEFFFALDKHSYGWTFTKYDFDYKKGNVVAQRGFREGWQVHFHDTIKIPGPTQDGLSIYYYARGFARQQGSYEILTFFKENLTTTKINFYKETYPVKIDAVDYPIDCVRLDGVLGYTGIFGLTGNYEGYFTNDEACIPVKASLKVIIGNINVELKSWRRDGWKPPKRT